MQTALPELTRLTLIISTILILFFGSFVIYFLFVYQRKKFRHQKEIIELREAFSQTLLLSKLEIQEQVLDHIAKELHANFSHLVSLININLSEILPQSENDLKENVVETKALAKQLLAELKALSASLNTDHIINIGFQKALDNELLRLIKTKKFKVSFIKTGEEFRLSPETEIILFRLCQEILNNVVKYSKASIVIANIEYKPDSMKLSITDDGVGFNMDQTLRQAADNESTGLLNIKKRAKLIGASLNIDTEESKGTSVIINVPKTFAVTQSFKND